jgi:capsid protein
MRPVLNAYEAGSQGRRFKLWTPTSLGPNAALLRDLKTVRDRSRDSVRNNAWMGKGVGSLVANEIGTGISPRPM